MVQAASTIIKEATQNVFVKNEQQRHRLVTPFFGSIDHESNYHQIAASSCTSNREDFTGMHKTWSRIS